MVDGYRYIVGHVEDYTLSMEKFSEDLMNSVPGVLLNSAAFDEVFETSDYVNIPCAQTATQIDDDNLFVEQLLLFLSSRDVITQSKSPYMF